MNFASKTRGPLRVTLTVSLIAASFLIVSGCGSSGHQQRTGAELLEPRNAIVIARGPDLGGKPFKMFAYKSSFGLCIDVLRGHGAPGSCGNRPLRPGENVGFTSTSECCVVGQTRGGVARVSVSYKVGGQPKRSDATLARVRGKQLGALGVRQPFGYFVAAVPQRRSRSIVATAYDAGGHVVGRTRTGDATLPLRPPG
jgi:hypothetical protein